MTHDSSTLDATTRPISTIGRLRNVTQRHCLTQLSVKLDDIRDCFSADLRLLEGDLSSLQQLSGDVARRAAGHLLERPGKRIRPLCVLLGAKLVGVPIDDRVRHLAITSELVHAATLLHDDVIDEAPLRRGAPAARMVYGNSASILAGDFLLIEALERVQRATGGDNRGVLDGVLEAIAQMVAAEALQLERRGRVDPNRDTALRIIEGKTAYLFRWALSAAARLDGRPAQEVKALADAGNGLGIAFQIVDDLLDVVGDPERTGKALFGDIAQGKLTWPLILACERDASLADGLRDFAASNDPALANRLMRRVHDLGVIEDTRAFADDQHAQAIAQLDSLPDRSGTGPARTMFRAIASAMVGRRH